MKLTYRLIQNTQYGEQTLAKFDVLIEGAIPIIGDVLTFMWGTAEYTGTVEARRFDFTAGASQQITYMVLTLTNLYPGAPVVNGSY